MDYWGIVCAGMLGLIGLYFLIAWIEKPRDDKKQ